MSPSGTTIEATTASVATHFGNALAFCGVTHAEWHRNLISRKGRHVAARHAVWAWMWTNRSLPGLDITLREIADVSGGFNHSTVMHGLRKVGVYDEKAKGGAA